MHQLTTINDAINRINLKYNTLVEVNQKSKQIEQIGLQNIQEQLAELVQITKNNHS
ncbi:hypothetical protein H1P_3560007 [Hyella patelloides LEGE 07179]|uniref:Uncharacterized protein n=2 Tax=Hyella TaxID=945733 RepID=A0A563VWM2_9CYAN|nr:hypothetical protein H1P_3560007 [Hyella patelloides LEGE 07179]